MSTILSDPLWREAAVLLAFVTACGMIFRDLLRQLRSDDG